MPRAELIRRLGATVGVAKAQSAVEVTAQALGLTDPSLDAVQCEALLERLGAGPDIVSIAARLLKAQLTLQAAAARGGTPVPR